MKNFTKFTGKYLCRSLFSKKVTGYLQNFLTEKTIWEVYFIGFSLLGGGGNSSLPPIAKNLLIPLPTRKNPPPPPKVHPTTKYQFSERSESLPPPNKKFPQQNLPSHCTGGKGFFPYPLNLFGKLWPPSFQSLNQSFISNEITISM